MPAANTLFEQALDDTRRIAREIAAQHAAAVDRDARFPIESITALKEAKLLSAPIPASHGGAGFNMRELGQICSILAGACGASGMVLAMHYIQVACIARHVQDSQLFADYLREIVECQHLLASMTSEVGTSGDTRSSVCAVERADGRFKLDKEATTGSYCAHADAILVTCRRAADAPKNDQALVLVRKADILQLQQTTSWDTLGMRGTCSPGFSLKSAGDEAQVLPIGFGDISAETMVPYSHILWAALWSGIAADALARAATFVRAEARKNPGTVPQTATRLAEAQVQLQSMRHNWQAVAEEFDRITDRAELLSIGWALKMNQLKIGASDAAPQIVHRALQIVGILGYKNDSPFSLGRHYRDTLSASLMISNDRIAAKSASMLLVFKDE